MKFFCRFPLIAAAAAVACGSADGVAGLYEGVIPAADCPGIDIELTLYDNGLYDLKYEYMERDSEYGESGSYTLNGDVVTLAPDSSGTVSASFRREDGILRMLDSEGGVVGGELSECYILKKQQ